MRLAPNLAVVVVLIAVARPARSDDPPLALEQGSRVRVTRKHDEQRPERFVATLDRLDEGELLVRLDGEPLRVPLDSIETLELRTGRKARTLLGAGIGGGVGLALGVLVVASLCEADSGCDNSVTGVLVLTGAGALVGAAVGTAFHSDEWRAVPLHEPGVTLHLRSHQLRLHATLRSGVAARLTLRF